MKFHALRKRVSNRVRSFGPQGRLARKVGARKEENARSGHTYTDDPQVSVILLSFNHKANVEPIMNGLRRTATDEVIVCEDGSIDGSREAWLRHLTRPNDFLIYSNDIHEIRSYNRAVGYARGEIVCVIQDDDIPPESGDWISDAVALFDAYPKLAALGCWRGWTMDFDDTTGVRALSRFGVPSTEQAVSPIPFADPETNLPFMFIEGLGIGPMFFRRRDYIELGGFDHRFSAPGEPGIMLDYDICLRAWLAGKQVALYGAEPFRRYVGGQGTMIFGKSTRKANLTRNADYIRSTYKDELASLRRSIGELNQGLVARSKGADTDEAIVRGSA